MIEFSRKAISGVTDIINFLNGEKDESFYVI